ncbi:MAG: ROK family protein [Ruminococcaceae bacterium]|nr:ROK family protein [Oscillospiraceae bacterium]
MERKYKIGIDLGGTNIKVGIVDEENKIISKEKCKTGVERPWQEVVRDMADISMKALKKVSLSVKDCISCGVGCPGMVDPQNGVLVYAGNFPGWDRIPLAEALGEILGIPVKMSNDANCAALGEYVAGAATDADSALLITLGTGVGGGLVYEGKIFEGGATGAAEFGHVTLHVGGELCTCGRRGCAEAYCSATALIRDAVKLMKEDPKGKLFELCGGDEKKMDGEIPFLAMKAGDVKAKELVDRYIENLSELIVDFVNVFRPEVVLLSGGICAEGTVLTDPINEFLKKNCFAGPRARIPEVRCALLGNDAGIVGSANIL